MFNSEILELARRLVDDGIAAEMRVATAESCTGGLIAGAITTIAGSSAVLNRGFVTYDNDAKTDLLGVKPALLQAHGAVSEPVAIAMAEGALERAPVDLTVSVTGVAGPGGGTAEKPVGLVHMASAGLHRPTLHERHVFSGDREAVRLAAVAAALALLCQQMETPVAP